MTSPMSPGATHAGFRLEDIQPLDALNLRLWRFRHLETGARLVHLESDDENNLFAVTFRTPPQDSTGVAHILEHTVLCGSDRYPVRDPFFAMLKRSLNTFMNAMTASDWTSYPFASQNPADFYNLLGIYLDAAFFPLLRERDFRQEGHRVEPVDPQHSEGPLNFQGVVFNEMKGAMASPSSLISRRLTGALYPTTTYRFNSGGEPVEIPDLSWEELKSFHARYYHPSNSWFFTYGNLPVSQHLEAIQEQALKHFSAAPVTSEVPPETRRDQPWREVETFPLAAGEKPSGKSMLQVAWLTCDINDHQDRLGLNLLSTLLLGNPSAPLYQALLESRLGTNLAPGIGYHDENRTTYFAAGLQGTDPEHLEAIEKLVLETLERIAAEGFPPDRVEGALHRLEFSSREVTGDSYPYPLVLLMRMLGCWLHAEDPVSPLQVDRQLAALRRDLQDPAYLPGLIRKHLLGNRHRLTLLLQPEQKQPTDQERELSERLRRLEMDLDPEKKQALARQALELKAAQEAEEDLSCLPTLTRQDIPPAEPDIASRRTEAASRPVYWFPQPTNGIAYFNAHLPTGALPAEQLALLPLLGALLPLIGAAGHSYLEMAARIEAATGGIQATTEVLEVPSNAADYAAHLVLKGRALLRNQEPLFAILAELCTAPDFSDLQRLHTVLNQVRTSLENSIPGSGHSYAARAAAGHLSPSAQRREIWSGLSQVRLIKELAALTPAALGETAERLRLLSAELFRRDHFTSAVTSEEGTEERIRPALEGFLGALPSAATKSAQPLQPFSAGAARLGFSTSVPVAYVTRVYRGVSFTHPDAPALTVLAKLLKSGFLHREIREKGGAYGGMAGYNPESGLFSMLSYRDPQITRTLRVYEQAVDWAVRGGFSDQAVDEAVLAVFGDLDRPLSPGGKGSREFANILQGLDLETRNAYRQGVLACGRDDLARVAARYLGGAEAQSAVAVIAGPEALEQANRELGSEGLEISRI